MSTNDIPKQVKVNTDPHNGYGHRYDAIMAAKNQLDAGSKTTAIVRSCDIVDKLAKELPEVLEELPPEQAKQLAQRLSGRGLRVKYEHPEVTIEVE